MVNSGFWWGLRSTSESAGCAQTSEAFEDLLSVLSEQGPWKTAEAPQSEQECKAGQTNPGAGGRESVLSGHKEANVSFSCYGHGEHISSCLPCVPGAVPQLEQSCT
jgi:hypothetical protein